VLLGTRAGENSMSLITSAAMRKDSAAIPDLEDMRNPPASLRAVFAIASLAAMIACNASSLEIIAAPAEEVPTVLAAQAENAAPAEQPPAQPAGAPRTAEDHDPAAMPGQDELYLFGELPDAVLDATHQAILALGVRTVVFDCPQWVAYPEQVKTLATRLRRSGVAVVLHVLPHPKRDGQPDWAGSDVASIVKMYRACGATGIYDDGAGAGRDDATLNARLYPEIKAVLDALPWAPTYFATANGYQVMKGDPRAIKSVGFQDWYRDDPGWGNFSKDFWRQLDGAVRMTLEAQTKAPRASPMIGWVRWHADWDDPAKQFNEIQAVIVAAGRHNFGISWQINVANLPRLGPLTRKAFALRAEYMTMRSGRR
jgi:hypothetical protein